MRAIRVGFYASAVSTALLLASGCSSGHSGIVPPSNGATANDAGRAVLGHRRQVSNDDTDVDQYVPQDAKREDRETFRALLRHVPKALRKRAMFYAADGALLAGSKAARATMTQAFHVATSKYGNEYAGPDGRSFFIPGDGEKKPAPGPLSDERATSSGARAPQLAAGQTPAPSTSNGAFRRVFSKPGYDYTNGTVYLPCDSATFQSQTQPDGTTKEIEGGWAYTGGWGIGAGGYAVDAGFQRSSTAVSPPNYAPFIKLQGQPFNYGSGVARLTCGQDATYEFYSTSPSNLVLYVTGNYVDGTSGTQPIFQGGANGWGPDGGTGTDGVVVKRMTTISQPEGWSDPNSANYNPNWASDGSQWGFDGSGNPAVHWAGSQIGYLDSSGSTIYYDPWTADYTGGYQRYPDDGTKVVVNPFVSSAEETDAINLHP